LKKFPLVVVAILGFILIAASMLHLMARPQPSALVLDDTCEPPCWLGITPGVTSPWGVSEALLGARFIDQPSIDQWGDAPAVERIMWRFRRPAGDLAGFAYFEGERVSYLRILTLGAMDLGEALAKFGTPDAFWFELRQQPTEAWTQLNIIYPDIACVLEVRLDHAGKPAPASVTLSEHSAIRAVAYFDPSAVWPVHIVPTEQMHEWRGLGEIALPTPTE
jgi:hypothetical protein